MSEPREGFIPWLRRTLAGNLPVDAEVARLRQELEWANARVDKAERMAADAALREEEAVTDADVERVALALWIEFTLWHAPAEYPTWGELLAQGHQGSKRVAEFRQYARAAINARHLGP